MSTVNLNSCTARVREITLNMKSINLQVIITISQLCSIVQSRFDGSNNNLLLPSNGPGKDWNTIADIETKNLDQLYAEALREGGRVVLYAGGDTPGQQDYFKNLFEARFPGITLDVVVDYSKFHNARIDHQLAHKNLIPDVVQLQTLQDFPRWKKQGVLLRYKPSSWNSIYNEFKDSDGFYTGIYIIAFTNCANRNFFQNPEQIPRDAYNYLKPEFRNKITITYPNDDDAVLFYYKMIVDKYGWRYIQQLILQNPRWVRGTQEPADAIAENRTHVAPVTACPFSNSPDQPLYVLLPRYDPFVTWPQTAAIFKNARRPAAAKLYLNWITDAETQRLWIQWSVRRDVPAPSGFRGVFDYPNQTDPTAFAKWMSNREQVELFRQQISLYIGEVQGLPSPGFPGIYPERALPH